MVELGRLRDHQEDEEPAFRCRAPSEGRREPGGNPGGLGGPGGPREGPPVSDPGGVARQGADVAGLPGGGGQCSASRMRTPTTGSSGPCATPSPTGATAGETRHRHSPSPHTSGGAGDSPDGKRERVAGGQCRGTPPPAERGPAPPTIRRDRGARATSRGGEGGDNERGGKPTAPQPTNR